MMFFGKKKTPSSALRAPSPTRAEGDGAETSQSGPFSPRRRRWLGAAETDEGAFSERDCAIWQDIRRALEGGAK